MDNPETQVRLSGFLRCATVDEVEIVKAHLTDHVRLTKAEPGCLPFVVSQTENPLVWCVEEVFSDRAAFDFHQQRTRASEWFTATSMIQRDYVVTE